MKAVSHLLILLILVIGILAPLYPVNIVKAQTENMFCPWRHGDYDYNYMLLNSQQIPIDVMRRWVFDEVDYVIGNSTDLIEWGKVRVVLQGDTFYKLYGSYPSEYNVEACILDGQTRTFSNCTLVLNTTSAGEYIIDLKDYMNVTGWSNLYLVATAKDSTGTKLLHDAVHLLFYWDYMTDDWNQYVDVWVTPTWPTSYPARMGFVLKISSTDTNAYQLLSSATDLRQVKITLIDNNGVEWPVNYGVVPDASGDYLIPISFYVNSTAALSFGGQLHLRIYLLKYPIADWLSITYIPAGSVTGGSYNTVTDNGWGIAVLNQLAAPSTGTGYKATWIPTDSIYINNYKLYIVSMDGTESGDGWGVGYLYSGTAYFKFRWLQSNYPEHYLSTGTWYSFAPSFSATRDGMTNIFYMDYVNDRVSWIYKYFNGATSYDTYSNLGGQLQEDTSATRYIAFLRYYDTGSWLSNPVVYYARAIDLPTSMVGTASVGNTVIPSPDLSYYCSGQSTTSTTTTSSFTTTTNTAINVPALLLWLLPLIIILISVAALGLAGGIAAALLPIMALGFAGLVPLWFVVSMVVALLLVAAFLKRGGGGG